MPKRYCVNNIVHSLKDGNVMVLHTCLANIILSHLIALMKNLISLFSLLFIPTKKKTGFNFSVQKVDLLVVSNK